MADDRRRPSGITAEDVSALRASFEGVKEAIEDMSVRQSTTETKVEEKADTETVDALRKIIVGLFAVLLLVVLVAGIGWRNNNDRIDDFLKSRTQTRAGLCRTLDDMRFKHNHLVQTNIDERQALIDAAMDNPNTSQEQKDNTVRFFAAQIEAYKGDLNTIVDCTDQKAVDDLIAGLGTTGTTTSPSGG